MRRGAVARFTAGRSALPQIRSPGGGDVASHKEVITSYRVLRAFGFAGHDLFLHPPTIDLLSSREGTTATGGKGSPYHFIVRATNGSRGLRFPLV